VCNTVVRVTIKVNGKPRILVTHSPQTPEAIDLKFDFDDYVLGLTLRAKNCTIPALSRKLTNVVNANVI